jgi:hypothetical protein
MNMRRDIKLITSLALCLLALAPANAATVFYSPDGGTGGSGSIESALPLDKLGPIPLPRGRFWIRGDRVEVSMIPEWEFDRHIVLSGPVLDTRLTQTSNGTIATGTLFFNQGDWLNYYDNPRAIETVTTQMQSVSGRITSVDNSQIVMTTIGGQTLVLPMASVTAVRSPRAFTFTIPGTSLQQGVDGEPSYADARRVMVHATGTPFRMAALRREVKQYMNDGDTSVAKLVAISTVFATLEFAQLLPYIIVPATGSHLQHQMFRRQLISNIKENVPQ